MTKKLQKLYQKEIKKITGRSEEEMDDCNKTFRNLKGQIIRKFLLKEDSDQTFYLLTDKTKLKFGANDLGAWIEEYKKLKNETITRKFYA